MTYAPRRYRRTMRKSMRRKPRATKSLAALTKEVNSLKRNQQITLQREQYVLTNSTDVLSPYAIQNLTNYAGWTKLWPTTGTGLSGIRNKMRMKYLRIDNNVTLDNTNNEEGEIQFTYFCFSPKRSTGDLGLVPSLNASEHYTNQGGMVFLNPIAFKIHYVKRFTLTGGDGADMQADNNLRRFSVKIPLNKLVEANDTNWKTLTGSPDGPDNIYHVLFTNNAAGDLEEPRWTSIAVFDVDN